MHTSRIITFGFSRFFFLLNTLVGLSRSYQEKHRKLKRKKPYYVLTYCNKFKFVRLY